MLFSQRKGLKPIKSILQLSGMDSETRNGLWNIIKIYIWRERSQWLSDRENDDLATFFNVLWHSYFKYNLDTLPDFRETAIETFKSYFFKCPWNEVYDIIEFTINHYEFPYSYKNGTLKDLIDGFNNVLERECSGYRIVNKTIAEITSPVEIAEIEESIEKSKGKLIAVGHHLERSLELMSDRKSPDYRNSIKESISAVESFSKIVSQDEKATLGQALKDLETKISFHPALKNAFSNLYGYTSDEKGIRHSLLESSTIHFEDAKFMLTACSAFINYMKSKASRSNYPLV